MKLNLTEREICEFIEEIKGYKQDDFRSMMFDEMLHPYLNCRCLILNAVYLKMI